MIAPDDGRKPLSGREYYALRELFSVVSSFTKCADDLEKRVKSIKGGWRDYRLIASLSEKLMGNLLDTLPLKKLGQISRDLKHTVCEIKVTPDISGAEPGGYCYVPDRALVNTVSRVLDWECLCCDKRGADVKRCACRKDLEALYPWDFPLKGDVCPLAGYSLDTLPETEDEGFKS